MLLSRRQVACVPAESLARVQHRDASAEGPRPREQLLEASLPARRLRRHLPGLESAGRAQRPVEERGACWPALVERHDRHVEVHLPRKALLEQSQVELPLLWRAALRPHLVANQVAELGPEFLCHGTHVCCVVREQNLVRPGLLDCIPRPAHQGAHGLRPVPAPPGSPSRTRYGVSPQRLHFGHVRPGVVLELGRAVLAETGPVVPVRVEAVDPGIPDHLGDSLLVPADDLRVIRAQPPRSRPIGIVLPRPFGRDVESGPAVRRPYVPVGEPIEIWHSLPRVGRTDRERRHVVVQDADSALMALVHVPSHHAQPLGRERRVPFGDRLGVTSMVGRAHVLRASDVHVRLHDVVPVRVRVLGKLDRLLLRLRHRPASSAHDPSRPHPVGSCVLPL